MQELAELGVRLEPAPVDEAAFRDVIQYVRRPQIDGNRPDEEAVENVLVQPAVEFHVLVADRERVFALRLIFLGGRSPPDLVDDTLVRVSAHEWYVGLEISVSAPERRRNPRFPDDERR